METNTPRRDTQTMSDLQSPYRVQHYRKQIWAVGGGKGGVGKSLLSSSLAYCLARQGFQTIAVDLDLGGANLHTVLGQAPPAKCVSDFLSGSTGDLASCIVPSAYANLQIIGGAKDDLKITQSSHERIGLLLKQLRELKADFVVLDLGAGTNRYTLDFFNAADVRIITALPEPTSIENAYRFMKASYYQQILENPVLDPVRPLVEAAMTPSNSLGIHSPQHLLNEVNFQNPDLAPELKRMIKEWKVSLVVNQSRSQTDVDVGFSMKSVARKYFGIDLDYLGYIEYEPNVWQSVRRLRPILAEYPNSRIAIHIERIVNYLLKQARIETTLSEKHDASER
ncbi:MAG: MinD/ParA family protein [Proteobacteria bacterium]|nr:MinD/ParA family protein [Pseudomonadota bacterium]